MKQAELQEALLNELRTALAAQGYSRRQQTFAREGGDVRWLAHVAFIRHADDVDLTLDVAVRHHAVEDRLERSRALLKPAERLWTATAGVELGNYADHRQHRWTLRTPEDVKPVAQDVLAWFHRFGIGFLERFSSLTELLRVLEDDAEGRLICPLADVRAEVIEVARAIIR